MKKTRITIKWAEYDRWVGLYIDRKTNIRYICPIPCLLITIKPKRPPIELKGQLIVQEPLTSSIHKKLMKIQEVFPNITITYLSNEKD